MGNKLAKKQVVVEEERLVKMFPPWDRAYAKWLARDVKRLHGFVPVRPRAIAPPDHYVEIMRLNGWLDVDLNDPEISHLFKN